MTEKIEATIEPVILIIFGITGDLSRRKLLPALLELTKDGLLPNGTKILGVTRQNLTAAEIIKTIQATTQEDKTALKELEENFQLFQMDMSDANDYRRLRDELRTIDNKGRLRHLFYLSIPPAVFDEVLGFMGQAELHLSSGQNKSPSILVEKPFGYDLASAVALINAAKEYFDESQIYRIDHYLAKEMAQNILDFRFRNSLFERIWDNDHITKVVIIAHEKIGIEGRAAFYEQTGALRDLIQSHLLQLLALVSMEKPRSLTDSTQIHRERLKLLQSVTIPPLNEVENRTVRGQYESYQREVNDNKTITETYAAVRLDINNERWAGVPFLLQTGKAVNDKSTKIDVYFGDNVLEFRIQPDEGIAIGLVVKKPGHGRELHATTLEFSYQRVFPSVKQPEAYERVLLDAIKQDQTLFASSDEVIASWQIIEPILNEWAKSDQGLIIYKNGSKGPLDHGKLDHLLKTP